MREFLRTRIVSEAEFWRHFSVTGGVYFIADKAGDTVKIGFSRDPLARLSNLQVGNASRLELVGLIAGPEPLERQLHAWHREGHVNGEWFWDRGILSHWLDKFTGGNPVARLVCDYVPAREVIWYWHEAEKQHTRHVRTPEGWEPPLP